MAALIDPATVEFLESGCSLLVGTATPDGEPVAARGWGCRVVDAGPLRLRVLLGEDDVRGIEHARVGDLVAVTATSLRTLRSVQLKGSLAAIEAATPDDDALGARYRALFFGDAAATDGRDPGLLERMTPGAHVTWSVEVREVYDQTPGPTAGAARSVGS
jgi:hypothetical protein